MALGLQINEKLIIFTMPSIQLFFDFVVCHDIKARYRYSVISLVVSHRLCGLQMGDAPAPAAGGRGGFSRGFGDRGGERGRGDRGRGRGDRGRGRGRGKREDEEAWVPCTKLGRLVQQGKVCFAHPLLVLVFVASGRLLSAS